MNAIVYAFFPGKRGSDAKRDVESWYLYHWPAAVVAKLLPQAGSVGRAVACSARLLRERLPSAIEVVEAAALSEETETAMDEAERLAWELRDFVRQCEAHEQLSGQETLIRALG